MLAADPNGPVGCRWVDQKDIDGSFGTGRRVECTNVDVGIWETGWAHRWNPACAEVVANVGRKFNVWCFHRSLCFLAEWLTGGSNQRSGGTISLSTLGGQNGTGNRLFLRQRLPLHVLGNKPVADTQGV